MPPLLQLRDIGLTLGGAPLFEKAELSISVGDRIALVGRNGSGKSTLMRIAAGLTAPDRGTRFQQPSARLAFLPQEPDMSGFATALDYVLAGLGDMAVRPGPSAELRARTRTHIWGEVADEQGHRAASRLHGPEAGLVWTTITALGAAQKVLNGAAKAGYQTPHWSRQGFRARGRGRHSRGRGMTSTSS